MIDKVEDDTKLGRVPNPKYLPGYRLWKEPRGIS